MSEVRIEDRESIAVVILHCIKEIRRESVKLSNEKQTKFKVVDVDTEALELLSGLLYEMNNIVVELLNKRGNNAK